MDKKEYSNLVGGDTLINLPAFNEIRRETLQTTYKYFCQILKGKSINDFENLKELISQDSLPLFDDSLRLNAIDMLHLEDEVMKILLGQNEYQIQRVLNCSWFFKNLPAEICIKKLFPYVSVSLRCKIINRLSKNLESTEESEKYFEFIRKNYSNDRANFMLPRCSPEFILKYFQEAKPTFEKNCQTTVLLNICKRYPELGLQILSEIFKMREESSGSEMYHKILLYFAGYHTDLFMPFLEKYHNYLNNNEFGNRLTKKLVSRIKGDLFPDYVKKLVFKEKQFFLALSFDNQVNFLENVVINENVIESLSFLKWNRSTVKLSEFLNLVTPEKRLNMVKKVFNKVFDSNFEDHSVCWTSRILELLPLRDRAPFTAKLKELLKGEITRLDDLVDGNSFDVELPEKLIYLYDSQTAFEELKKVLRECPLNTRRSSILVYMVRNCRINNDTDTLTQIVEYVATRHRNDDCFIIEAFVSKIINEFPVLSLNTTIFEKVDDLLYFFHLKGQLNDYYYQLWKENYIVYRAENNLSFEDLFKKYFDMFFSNLHFNVSVIRNYKSKASRSLVVLAAREIIALYKSKLSDDSSLAVEDRTTLLKTLFLTCKNFNNENKRARVVLSEIPELEGILMAELKKRFAEVGVEKWDFSVWEKYYDEPLNPWPSSKILSDVIKRVPVLVKDFTAGFVKALATDSYFIVGNFRNIMRLTYSFVGVTENVKNLFVNHFKNSSSDKERRNCLTWYSHICNVEEFSELIKDYLPKDSKIEADADSAMHNIQMHIPKLIKNIKPRCRNLDLLMRFFFGDFLKSVLPSFYSCCYNTRVDVVLPFLFKVLGSVPDKISYRKDLIRLIIEFSSRKEQSEFCRKIWDEYKHYTIRCIVLRYVSKLFFDQPTVESFQLLEKCVLEGDIKTVEARPTLNDIPKPFWRNYVFVLWKWTETLENVHKIKYQTDLLYSFKKNDLQVLGKEFCEPLIQKYLFKENADLYVKQFAALYLVSDPPEVEKRVQMILDLIKNESATPSLVSSFFSVVICTSLENHGDFVEVFSVFLKKWPFPAGLLFEEKVLFNYHKFYEKAVKKGSDLPVEVGKQLVEFFLSSENLSELLVAYFVALNKYIGMFSTKDAIIIFKELITGTDNRAIRILAISSLPSPAVDCYKDKTQIFDKDLIEGKKILSELVTFVKGVEDPILEIYLNSKFGY